MLNYILRCLKYSSPFELKKFKSEGAALYDAIQQMLEFIIVPGHLSCPYVMTIMSRKLDIMMKQTFYN